MRNPFAPAIRSSANSGAAGWRFDSFRLAALSGDTAGAVKAYGHYLALRADAEPEVKPEVELVRAELAKLSQGKR